jgi:Bacteriocin-protection, YdeI or OmpD-Associated/Domain of unknown function (DUF1905)
MKSSKRFRARIEAISRGGHYVAVPDEAARAAGLAVHARVRGTVAGVAYRSSLMKYSGVFHMGVHKATLAAAGIKPGDIVEIAIELDPEPLPEDTVPPLLAKALRKRPRAQAAWKTLAPSHRREHARYINDAKKEETRAVRVARTIDALEARAAAKPTPRR